MNGNGNGNANVNANANADAKVTTIALPVLCTGELKMDENALRTFKYLLPFLKIVNFYIYSKTCSILHRYVNILFVFRLQEYQRLRTKEQE